jgi:Holliday junction DNA helicase RuvA
MFYYLSGTLEYIDATFCALDTAGVGYGLTVSAKTSFKLSTKLGEKVKLYTYLAVREDGVELFGFLSLEERECFNKLITVSGVGPKAAMSILSIMTADELSLAISTGDVKAISKASGIGKKTAERIVVDLRDKVSRDMMGGVSSAESTVKMTVSPSISEACEALLVLGYDKSSILNALKGLDAKTNDVGELVRLALKKLSR